MLQHTDEQELEENLAGISGLHGTDAKEIFKYSAITWKIYSSTCLHEKIRCNTQSRI
jgi:hypothetical protein